MRTFESMAARANSMRRITSGAKRKYWMEYLMGMIDAQAGSDQRLDDPSWRDSDFSDAMRVARWQGYADGLNWKTDG
jgi:hypothetical protein